MLDFFKFYAGVEIGWAIGKKLPGVLKALWKGFCFVFSVVIWASIIEKEPSVLDFHMSAGVTALNILYLILVWGGIIGLIALFVLKRMDYSKAYYILLLLISLAIGAINSMGEGIFPVLVGVFLGYTTFHLPWFIYSLALDVTRKIVK